MSALEGLRVGIVGGSIAGCAAAVELGRLGCDIALFERSRGELQGRGAGIGTPLTTFERLVERDLIDAHMPRCVVSDHPLVGCGDHTGPLGHTALTLPLQMALINWGDLWRNLRRRVPKSVFGSGHEVVGATVTPSGAHLELGDGGAYECDLAVFADGYRSLGRSRLFPTTAVEYRGYVLWRGVLEERDLSDSAPMETALYRLHYQDLAGNAVFYFVPGAEGSVTPGERWLNWACYLPLAETELSSFLVDSKGTQHRFSLPPGSMRPKEEERLKALMKTNLPSYFSDIIRSSQGTFAQPIYTVDMPAYAKDRACLLGDAGAVAPPFTGSGVFKATNNASDLADALESHASVRSALDVWSRTQTETGRRLAVLGRQMEQAFVWDAPDFSSMNEEAAMAWWKAAVTFPDDFSYVGRDA